MAKKPAKKKAEPVVEAAPPAPAHRVRGNPVTDRIVKGNDEIGGLAPTRMLGNGVHSV